MEFRDNSPRTIATRYSIAITIVLVLMVMLNFLIMKTVEKNSKMLDEEEDTIKSMLNLDENSTN